MGLNDAGTYNLTFLNVTAGPLTSATDLDGGALPFADSKSGTINNNSDLDAFTVPVTTGDRLVGALQKTSGTLAPTVYIYPPGGGSWENVFSSGRIDMKVAASGTYTIVVQDGSTANTGTYSLSLTDLNHGPLVIPADQDSGAVISGSYATGTINVAADMDVFHFSGTIGDRLIFGAIPAGGTVNTTTYIYPPDGSGAIIASSSDRFEMQLPATGTYKMVLQDGNFLNTGTYSVSFLDLDHGPLTTATDLDGGNIASSETKTGTLGVPTDMDVFRFAGQAGSRVLLGCITTAGAMNTTVYVYPPAGGPIQTTSSDRVELLLPINGTYSVVVQDNSFLNTGSYSLSLLNITYGPLTVPSDLDGGAIASNTVVNGTINTPNDFDAFTFNGSVG